MTQSILLSPVNCTGLEYTKAPALKKIGNILETSLTGNKRDIPINNNEKEDKVNRLNALKKKHFKHKDPEK